MPNPSATPTPITPPRVALIDARTGLIDRSWYMFFLSLFRAAQTIDNNPDVGPSAESLIASYAAELEVLTQIVGTQFNSESMLASLEAAINVLRDQHNLQPSPQVGELQQQIDALRQEIQTQRQPELGSMAPLEQDNVPWLTFNTAPSPVPTAVGTMAWDGGTTMGLQATANVLMRIGESEFVYVKASSAITKGQLCYHTGAVGGSGVITAAPTPLALADPNQIVGVAAESIALNGFGLIQISGDLRGFNTTGSSVGETWADGDPLYYNPAYVGSFTKTKPSAPNQKTYIGEVINASSGGSGSINVRIIPGSVLGGTDSNVQFSGLANSDLIQYDSTAGYWKNVPASTLPVGTATNIAGGAAGSVPYQSAPSTTTFLSIGAVGRWLGSSGTAPQWNAPAALTKTDDTNVTLTLGGSASTALLNAASLTLGWTGQLAVSRGGTGVATATANTVFAGPTTGAAAAPSFRALVSGDIPALSYVSSVGATAPITSTGGLTPTIGVTSAALTKVDDTNVTLTLGGSPTTALLAATSLTLGWTGQLSVARGGTGSSTAAGAITNLGATTVGGNFFTLTNPSAITFPRINADNTVSALTASAFRTAIGAGTGNGTVTSVSWTGGIVSVATATTTPAFTIAGTSGGIPYFSSASTWASSAALAANAIVLGGGAGAAPATTTTGTGVVTALGVNTGTAGAFVVNGGALGTPSSGTVTNLTGTASININGTVGATTPNTGAFTSVTSTSAAGVLTRAAATQDGVEMIGRAGGTTSLKVSLTPTTLTASRTVTLPDANIDFTAGLAVANGGTGSTTASGARTNLGATTVGSNFFTLTNPSAITFPRINADNTVSALDAATFRTAIGAGTGSGTVTSVTGTSPVVSSGGTTPAISLASGYGDTQNPYASKTANFVLAAPNGSAGAPTFRAIVAADIPTLNQNTTGSAGYVANSGGAIANISAPGSGTYNIHYWYANSTEMAIETALATNVVGGAKLPMYFTWRGGYATQGGLAITGPSTAALGGYPIYTTASTVAVANGGTGVTTTPTNGQLLIGNGTGYTVANLTAGTGVSISNSAGGISISATGTGGTVTSVSVVSANGFAGTVATATTTPAITISTSITGLLYGNGTAIAAATVSAPLTYSAGTLAITQATTSTNGYLSSTDWNTFNNKQPAGTYVTSVTGTSPVASSGGTTPAISLASGYGDTQNPYASKTANTFLAAPNGSAGVPTFRAIVAADIPSLPYQPTAAPVTYTANFSVAATDVWIINNKSGSSCTATLPAASSYSGRVLRFQNYQTQTLVSASSNVVQIGGGAATTSILLASAGDQATLVSDGTNWIMMQYIPNNILLLE
jgi:hypothetical protein